MNYEQWYAKVNLRVMGLTGNGADQIGEYPFLNDYESGMMPNDSAKLFSEHVKFPNVEAAIAKSLNHDRNNEFREAIRRIYCMGCADFINLMGFADSDYAIGKFREVQDNPAMALVDSLDEQHSDLLLNWALRK